MSLLKNKKALAMSVLCAIASVGFVVSASAEESVKMFERNGVYNKTELEARVDILIEEYRKSVKVEVLTLLDVSKKDILPALVKEIQFYADAQNALGKTNAYFTRKLDYLLSLLDKLDNAYHTLKKAMEERNKTKNSREKAYYLDEVVVPMINSLGDIIDKVEEAISEKITLSLLTMICF